MWGWQRIMFPNQQGRAEPNWGSVAGYYGYGSGMGVGAGDWYSWGSPPTGRPASQWGPGYSTEEDTLARSRMQHGQEDLRAPAPGGGRGHQEVDLGNARRGDQSQEQDFAVGSARDLSQRSSTATTTQAERLGINSNIYSLY